jgi:MoxR-like ATPase
MLFDQDRVHPLTQLKAVCDGEVVTGAQRAAAAVHVDEAVGAYMVDLVHATRQQEQVKIGASPRGSLALFRMAKATALLAGRDHVLPDDVQQVAVPVLAHRLILQTKARYAGVDPATIVEQVMDRLPVPR